MHRENKEYQVFALIVGKNGPKLKKAVPDAEPSFRPSVKADGTVGLKFKQLLTSRKTVNKVDTMQLKLSLSELQVMKEFWKHGRLSIREVQESFPEADRPPYTSIQTTVYRLEEKGAVRRVRKIGNAHVFESVISRQQVGGSAINDLLALFGGRTQTVMAHLVESGKLTRDDIREAERLIDSLEKRDETREE